MNALNLVALRRFDGETPKLMLHVDSRDLSFRTKYIADLCDEADQE